MMPTPQERIEAGRRVAAFLAEPAIVAAFDTLKTNHYEEFLAATERGAIDKAHSKAKVTSELLAELRAVVERGEFEANKIKRAERTQTPARR